MPNDPATRCSPLAPLMAQMPDAVGAALHHPTDLVKVGVKGPGLTAWAQAAAIDLPPALYDTLPVGKDGVLARVGNNELIVECTAADAFLHKVEAALATATSKVYRIEQQSLTLELRTDLALGILAQTCAVDFAAQPADRMVYTRIAGASCAVLPRHRQDQRTYRLWVDFSLAPYLWETLVGIAAEFIPDQN